MAVVTIALSGFASIPTSATTRITTLTDGALGISLSYPSAWTIYRDPVLKDTYGFLLYGPSEDSSDAHHEMPVARIALDYNAKPAQLESLVQARLGEFPNIPLVRSNVRVGQGLEGVAIGPMPGQYLSTLVYVAANHQVYQIRIYGKTLDTHGKNLLAGLRFHPPTQSIASLGLLTAEEDIARQQAAAQSMMNHQREAAAQQAMKNTAPQQEDVSINACGATQWGSLFWQVQWDDTANFYGYPGWSILSGNGGSFWGEGYHVGLCWTDYANSYYAIDYPLQRGAYVYAAFSGYVTYAGWGSNGWDTLGKHVDVRSSQSSYVYNVSAHLDSIWVSNGQYVSAGTIIGTAGSTGGNWAPHLHTKVDYTPSMHWTGQLYGGHSMKPTWLRCFNCTSGSYGYDQPATDGYGGGYYTSFWKDRWIMW
ncbi:MAG TPA: M23 family metallopeptidase [Herpetosiphonaceae bacterium]